LQACAAADGVAVMKKNGVPVYAQAVAFLAVLVDLGLKRWVSRSLVNLGTSRFNCAALAIRSSLKVGTGSDSAAFAELRACTHFACVAKSRSCISQNLP